MNDLYAPERDPALLLRKSSEVLSLSSAIGFVSELDTGLTILISFQNQQLHFQSH